MEPMIGEIRMFGGNFAPRAWALCNGQLLAISQNQALFSILGTTYGGDGRTTFALPDMRGRAAIQHGQGPGLSDHRLGARSGTETNVLNQNNLPPHSHAVALTGDVKLPASSDANNNTDSPSNAYPSNTDGTDFYADAPSPGSKMAPMDTSGLVPQVMAQGGSQSMNNMMPFNTLNYIIALQGIFPSRS